MNKRFVVYLLIAIIISAVSFSVLYIKQNFIKKEGVVQHVPQEQQLVTSKETQEEKSTTTDNETRPASTTEKEIPTTVAKIEQKTPPPQQTPQQQISITQKIVNTVTNMTYAVSSFFTQERGDVNETTIPPTSYITTSDTQSPYEQLPPQDFAGQKYIVIDGNIVTADNKVIYNIPPQVYENASGGSSWTNTVVSVTAIGTVPPVIGAIPVLNLPGKFYLSTNSFGDMEQCQFSNKIFILDTIANTTTLIYEENNTTLTKDDPRACNSEIFLLATDNEKLVLKYHTIGTNTLCDSAWSEPEKTFYIDVTKLQTEGMRKYTIPVSLSENAEQEEAACRALLSATGTQQ